MQNPVVTEELEKIRKVLEEVMTGKRVSFQVDDLSNKHHNIINVFPFMYAESEYGDKLDGMQINYEDGVFEVSEYQAGPNEDELHIYLETKSFKRALSSMLKGNGRKPIKVWN